MRIIRFSADRKTRYGLLKGNTIQTILGNPITQLKGPGTGFKFEGGSYQLNEVKLLAPCVPTKIVALGINYRAHAEEANKFPIPGNFVAFMIWLSFHTLVSWIIFFPPKAWVNSMQAGWEVVLLYAVGGVLLFNIVFVVILVGSNLNRKR